MIYTIGHSNHAIERFLQLLEKHGVQSIADVRSRPASRFNPQFNRKALQQSLAARGIGYEFLGAELGARTEDPACHEDGRVSYTRLAATAAFREGLSSVLRLARERRLALLCAEHEPLECHRNVLVGWELRKHGEELAHILRDGSLESQAATDTRLIETLQLDAGGELFAADDLDALTARAYAMQAKRIAYVPARRA